MRIIYSQVHLNHRPNYEVFNGIREIHADTPQRIENIKEALVGKSGLKVIEPKRFPLSWIEKVHSHDYISYIARAGRHAGGNYVYPSVFPYESLDILPTNEIAKRGVYSYDLYTPVSASTYESARMAVMTSLTASSFVRRGERVVYALTRPPGHHAERKRMGGYCYFNNAAIAANYLSTRGRVAILDIDFHHGNGTQQIFYDRSDVLFVSIHASPKLKFPYFSGSEGEKGRGQGKNYNLNFPLSLSVSDSDYQRILIQACKKISDFKPNYLVVSVGFDTHKDDPVGGFRLSTRYYFHMAKTIHQLNIPTVLVQEGGYNNSIIGDIAVSFINGFIC